MSRFPVPRPISFVEDIRKMMFGLGDSPEPLESTAELIEKIVLEEMLSLLECTCNVRTLRGAEVVGPEDILFLMRKDLVGLKRLIKYLSLKDEKASLSVPTTSELPEASMMDLDPEEVILGYKSSKRLDWSKNRKACCFDFLEALGIDEFDLEFTEDPQKTERDVRLDNLASSLSSAAYQEFHAARCASFGSAQITPTKFLEWIRVRGNWAESIPNPVAEVMVYLAKETVAHLIDMALKLREEKEDYEMTEPPPITVDEIQEVMRRFNSVLTVPYTTFTRDIPPFARKRFLAIQPSTPFQSTHRVLIPPEYEDIPSATPAV